VGDKEVLGESVGLGVLLGVNSGGTQVRDLTELPR